METSMVIESALTVHFNSRVVLGGFESVRRRTLSKVPQNPADDSPSGRVRRI